MFIVFAQHITPRLDYIVKAILGSNSIITRDIHKFSNSSLKKINYSSTKFDSESLWIAPYGLLEEVGIEQRQIDCFEWEGLIVFFETKGTLPFDIFSAAFYLLSRYEEYTGDFKTDAYGNYHHDNSLAFKENFLHLPLINLWLNKIQEQYHLRLQTTNFRIIPTYDVDIAFAYKHHSFIKTAGGILTDAIKVRRIVIDRIKVLFGLQQDPFDVFEWLDKLHRKYKLKAKYFFLVAKKRGLYDKNPMPTNKGYKKLIKQHSLNYEVGVHPSYVSNNSEDILKAEVLHIKNCIRKEVEISRQHYLQLSFPATYQNLINAGIKNEYSLGYGTHNGFRASYSLPFFWYNLPEEKQTTLMLHPFCYMDANSIFEQKLTPETALQEMHYYYNTVKKINGDFIYIMHNHFLANQTEWKKWVDVYEDFLRTIND
jgi:hypothetical protein